MLCAVSTVRAYLNGLEDFTVRGGDVLTAPAYTVGNTVASFDYSVMFPPLGLPWEKRRGSLPGTNTAGFPGDLCHAPTRSGSSCSTSWPP